MGIFSPFQPGEELQVWMSHGDRLTAVAARLLGLGSSNNAPLAAIAHPTRRLYGIQFHPEVAHTPRGAEILRAFLFDVVGPRADLDARLVHRGDHRSIAARVGPDERVICGLSGGVDSSVAAVLCHRALGDRLVCIFVDNGVLRARASQRGAHDAQQLPLEPGRGRRAGALPRRSAGVTDPEQKRKIIGRVVHRGLRRGGRTVENARWLVQGTLYPDVIESVSVKGPSAVIKSHHNVGGLPERMKLKLIEPLRELFKDEVRQLGERHRHARATCSWRHPFPGPGLAIRCLGEVTEPRLAVLREADAIVTEEIRAAGLYDSIWQAFAVLLPVRSVGVMGDERTYEETCAVRAVHSVDGMTADWARLPYEVLASMSPHHQRGQGHQPRGLRHQVEASGHHRVGMIPKLRALACLLLVTSCLPNLRAAVDMRIVPARGTPGDASVIIDEELIGPLFWVAANNIRLPVGEHRITVQKEGYFPWDRMISADREPIRLEVSARARAGLEPASLGSEGRPSG